MNLKEIIMIGTGFDIKVTCFLLLITVGISSYALKYERNYKNVLVISFLSKMMNFNFEDHNFKESWMNDLIFLIL